MTDEIVWTTASGHKMTMKQIGDRHLLNIIGLLRRRALSALSSGYMALSCLQGEMAQDAAESEIDKEQDFYAGMTAKFEAEAKARGISLK